MITENDLKQDEMIASKSQTQSSLYSSSKGHFAHVTARFMVFLSPTPFQALEILRIIYFHFFED